MQLPALALEYKPLRQSAHATAPAENLPIGHAVHGDPNLPAGHPLPPQDETPVSALLGQSPLQSDEERPVVAPNLPAGQLMQVDEPFEAEYLPLEQLAHKLEFCSPELSEYFPSGHIVQLDDPILPVLAKYLPASHSAHSVPAPGEYFPKEQGVHSLSSIEPSVTVDKPEVHLAQFSVPVDAA